MIIKLFLRNKKKKQRRNFISLKKGSLYEDLALIQELSNTISYIYGLKGICVTFYVTCYLKQIIVFLIFLLIQFV